MDESTLYHARAQAMIDFAEGRITETEERFDDLLNSDPPLTPMQEVACLLDRSTVRAQANMWQDALDDLAICEALVPKLPPIARKLNMGAILHAKVKLRADPFADTNDLAAASRAVNKLRKLSPDPWLVEELESGLALQQGDWERCVQCSSTASRLLEAAGWRKPLAVLNRRMAEAHIHLNRLDLAQRDLQPAFEFFTEFGPPYELARTELTLARLKSQSGEHDDAWDHALHALSEIELLIRNFRVVPEQQQFLKDKQRFYDDCFDIGLANGGDEGCSRAWTIAERAKSFYLCQLLANADVPLFEGADPKDIERLRQLEAQLDICARSLVVCNPADRDAKEHQQISVSKERQALLARIMKENPRWAAVRAPIRADIEAILDSLPVPWVPISYLWRDRTDGTADLFVFYAGLDRKLHLMTVPWSKDELAALSE